MKLIKGDIRLGFNEIIKEDDDTAKYTRFGVLSLSKGENFDRDAIDDEETVLLILSGNCDISSSEGDWTGLGKRETVFDGEATALYFPPDVSYEITANADAEIAVVTALAKKGGDVTLVKPEDVKVETWGKKSWEREINKVVFENVNAETLYVSETFIRKPGNWVFPPHKHDEDTEDETPLEESYFYKVKPEQGFGIQRNYTDDKSMDDVAVVENNDTAIFPVGYHPTGATAGYQLYFLWMIAGEKRDLKSTSDPDHTWIQDE